MIVCHCKAVSDRAIRAAIASGAETPRQIARACGAGRVCGGCRPVVRRILERESAAAEAAVDPASLTVEAPLVATG